MSTREKIYKLIDVISPSDEDIVLQILERFVIAHGSPNAETVAAMLEADAIASDPNVKGYDDITSLREALDAE